MVGRTYGTFSALPTSVFGLPTPDFGLPTTDFLFMSYGQMGCRIHYTIDIEALRAFARSLLITLYYILLPPGNKFRG